jgi:hypothetical protein
MSIKEPTTSASDSGPLSCYVASVVTDGIEVKRRFFPSHAEAVERAPLPADAD